MFHQTFSLVDIPKVLTLIFLECVLSADNALIIATIIKPLNLTRRNKALWSGIAGAIILRIIAIIAIAYFIHFFWVQVLGAIYLLYLAVTYRLKGHALEQKKKKTSSKSSSEKVPLWKVILELECVDLIFAFDSIIAALAITGVSISSEAALPPKLWIVYLGGITGLVVMRFAAKLLSMLMDKLYNLEKASHYLIGWIGMKLGIESMSTHLFSLKSALFSLWLEIIFWIGVVLLFGWGLLPNRRKSLK
jgi:YkoY family integral membrane protein